MVGDRLDTDIEGAHNAGVDSLLVMTGVTGLPELVSATPEQRPTYLSTGLTGLLRPHPAVSLEGGSASVGGWSARTIDGRVVVEGAGSPDDWWRAVASVAWTHLDETGSVADHAELVPPEAGPGSQRH